MATDVGSAVGYLDLDISGFLSGLQSAQSQANTASKNIATTIGNGLQGAGKGMISAGSTLTKMVTAPLVTASTAAFAFSTKFESAMAKVETIADKTQKPIGDIKTEIIDLSNKTGAAATDIAEATYQAISAGVDTSSAVSFVAQSSKLATAGFTDTTTAVDALTTILNAYGLEASDAEHVSDVLISTQNKGKTTVNELASSMGKIIPTANAMGVSLEDLGVGYSYLTAGGIATADATTYMNGMFNELGKSGTTVSDILKEKTGKSFQELVKSGYSVRDVLDILQQSADEAGLGFNDLWSSQEASRAATALLNTDTKDYNDTLKDFQTTQSDTEEAFNKMADTTEYKLKVAMQNGKNALMQLGDTLKTMLLPFIEKGVEWIKNLNEWLSTLSDSEKEQIVKIAAIAAAIGPVLMVLGKLTTGIGNIITKFNNIPASIAKAKSAFAAVSAAIGGISAPVVAVVAAIGALIAAFANLWKTNEKFRNKMTAIWDGIKSKFESFAQGIVDRLNALGFDFENFGEVVKAIWDGFCSVLAPIFEAAFEIISSVLGTVLDMLTGILDVFIGIFTGNWEQCWNGIKEIFVGIWNGLVGILQSLGNMLLGIFDTVCGWFGTTWDETWTNIKQFFVDIWNGITSFFSNVINAIKTTVYNFITTIINFFAKLPTNIVKFITNAYNAVVTWATNMVNKAREMGTNFINKVVSFFTQLPGKVLKFITSAFNNVKTWTTNMVNKAHEMGTNFIKKVVSFMQQLPGKIKQYLDNAINNLKTWVAQMGQKGKEAVQSLINNVMSAASGIASKVMSIGTNIVTGVWNGIKNTTGWFTDQVKNFFSGIVDSVKDTLGIHSPSKVMEDEVGKNIALGVIKGIKKKEGDAKKTASKMAQIIVDAASKQWERYNLTHKTTIAEEVAFWNEIKNECKKGTDAYYDALKKYKDADKSLKDSIKSVKDNYKQSWAEIKENLKNDIQEVVDLYNEKLISRTNEIKGQLGNLFSAYTFEETKDTTETLKSNLQSQVDALNDWNTQINALSMRQGVGDDFLQEVRDLGVSATQQVKILNSMTDEELNNYLSLWKQKNEEANNIAKEELAQYKEECEKQVKVLTKAAHKELNALEKEYVTSLKSLGVKTKNISKNIGVDIVRGLEQGIKSQNKEFTAFLTSFFKGIVSTAKATLGIHSPSKVFAEEVGKWLPAGMAEGFASAMPSAMKAIQKDLNKGINNIDTDDISAGAGIMVSGFADKLKLIYNDVALWFESIESRIGNSVDNMMQSLDMLIRTGQAIVNSDGTLGYIGYNGFTKSGGSEGYVDRTNPKDKDAGGNGDIFIFNSPKAIDEIEAAKQMKKTKQDMAEGF